MHEPCDLPYAYTKFCTDKSLHVLVRLSVTVLCAFTRKIFTDILLNTVTVGGAYDGGVSVCSRCGTLAAATAAA